MVTSFMAARVLAALEAAGKLNQPQVMILRQAIRASEAKGSTLGIIAHHQAVVSTVRGDKEVKSLVDLVDKALGLRRANLAAQEKKPTFKLAERARLKGC